MPRKHVTFQGDRSRNSDRFILPLLRPPGRSVRFRAGAHFGLALFGQDERTTLQGTDRPQDFHLIRKFVRRKKVAAKFPKEQQIFGLVKHGLKFQGTIQ